MKKSIPLAVGLLLWPALAKAKAVLDTLPERFHRHIRLKDETVWFGDFAATPDGGSVIVGNVGGNDFSREGLIMKADPLGGVEWAKAVGFDAFSPPSQPGLTMDIDEYFRGVVVLPDSGFIVLGPQRRRGYPPQIEHPFLARFNRLGDLLWAKDIILPQTTGSSHDDFAFAIAPGTGSSFYVAGVLSDSRSFVIQINADEASILSSRAYSHTSGARVNFEKLSLMPDGGLAIFGTHTGVPFSPLIPFSSVMLKLDPQGLPLVHKRYRFAGGSSLGFDPTWGSNPIGDGFFIGTGLQQQQGTFQFDRAALLRTDLEGNLLWAKSYDDSTLGITDFVDGIHAAEDGSFWLEFSDGYYLTLNGNNDWSDYDESPNLARIDSMGNILWNANYGDSNSRQTKGAFQLRPGGRPLVCSEAIRLTSGIELMALDSEAGAGCADRALGITVEDIPVTVEDFFMEMDTLLIDLVDFDLPVREVGARSTDLCCTGLPDMDIWTASVEHPCPNTVAASIEVCNNATVPGGFGADGLTVAAFDADPFRTTANLLTTFSFADLPNVLPGCQEYQVEVPLPATGEVYFLLNPPPGQAPPFDPYCGFAGAVPECSYRNNLDSIQVSTVYSTSLDLGPDKLICPGTQVTLNPGPGFDSFLWQDGSTDSLFTVQDVGSYWVQTTDLCGIGHSDTLSLGFEVVEQFDFGMDTLWSCNNDTVYLSIPQIYEEYEWYRYPSASFTTILCWSCAETGIINTVFPTLFVGIGVTSQGCQARDSIIVYPYPTHTWNPEKKDTFSCINEMIYLGDSPYSVDTTIDVTLQTIHGCDSIVTYTVLPLDTSYAVLDTATCEGSSLMLGGQLFQAGEEAAIAHTNEQGCDSTVLYRVAALPHSGGMEEVAICPDATAYIFGNEESQPGLYTGNFTAANGCDSVHQVLLSVLEVPEVGISTTLTCKGKMEGSARAETNGGHGPFLLEWDNGETEVEMVENLPGGQHSLTVTDANGCRQTYFFEIENYPPEAVPMECEPRVYAPTAFSPNGDGVNDRFTLYGNRRALEIVELQIYDVWGERVNEAKNLPLNDEARGWDGTLGGQPMNPGVFPWRAVVRGEDGSQNAVRGDVALLR